MAVISIKNKIKSGSLLAGNEFFELGDYESIATANGTGSSNLITFSNIPQTYQHLQLRVTSRTALAAVSDTMYVYNFNGSTASTNSATHLLYANGSSVLATNATGSYSSIIGYTTGANALSNAYGVAIVDFLDYSNTNKNKTIRSLFGWDDNGVTSTQATYIGLQSSFPVALGTGAITEMTIVFNANITTASSFALYGIKG